MFSGFKLFERESDKFLRIDYVIDVRMCPSKLFYDLKSQSDKKQMLKNMTKKTNNGFKIMRRLTVAHLLLMFSDQFYDLVEEFVQSPSESTDSWLNQQCIRTYYHFLKKIVASRELYISSKEFSIKDVCFEKLFYLINLITDMFKIVAKMPLLGRYFKDNNQLVTCSFVEGIAVQAQKIYTVFKNGLLQILSNHKEYIKNRQDQQLVKAILEDSLPYINEEMKKLFLDKYFYPYGKGIGIRLFRTQQQTEQTMKIINGIISDHKDTERKIAQEDLEKTLFPQDGKVNLEFYERTLKPTQSKNQQVIIKDLEDIQQQQEVIPTQFDETTVMEEKQKSTSDHLQICHDV